MAGRRQASVSSKLKGGARNCLVREQARAPGPKRWVGPRPRGGRGAGPRASGGRWLLDPLGISRDRLQPAARGSTGVHAKGSKVSEGVTRVPGKRDTLKCRQLPEIRRKGSKGSARGQRVRTVSQGVITTHCFRGPLRASSDDPRRPGHDFPSPSLIRVPPSTTRDRVARSGFYRSEIHKLPRLATRPLRAIWIPCWQSLWHSLLLI
jgi:hypothetical protein